MKTPIHRLSSLAWLIVVATLAIATIGPRTAQGQSATDSATAEILFNEALALLENDKPAAACRKLEESQRLDPGVGTLLYLADCYQQLGRTASAWATFKEAAYMAKGHADEREAVALEHARELEPKLSYLTLEVNAPEDGELTLLHDGKVVGQPLWGTAFPVDPGAHQIEASAPGKKSWSASVNVVEGPHQERLVVPALEAAPPEPPASMPAVGSDTARPGDDGSTQELVGWVLVGTGSAAIVTSGIFALLARGDDSDAAAECRPDRADLCNPAGVDLGDSAKTKATIAGVSAGVGLAAIGAGVTLLLIAPTDANDAELALSAGPRADGGQMSFSARW